MIATVHYDEKAALEVALNKFRRYNKAVRFSMDDKEISNRLVERIFLAEPQSKEETDLINILKKAAEGTIHKIPGIPAFRRVAQERRIAREISEAVLGAKNDFLHEKGYFGAGTAGQAKYEQAQKAIPLVRYATDMDNVRTRLKDVPKNLLRNQGVKAIGGVIGGVLAKGGLLSTALAGIGGTVILTIGGTAITVSTLAVSAGIALGGLVLDMVVKAIPKKYKESMKKTAYRAMQSAGAAIHTVTQKLRSNPVGRKVETTYERYVAPVVNKGKEIVEKAYNTVKSGVTKVTNFLKSLF